MVSEKVIIRNQKGLHLKPAGYLCQEALLYESLITMKTGNKEVNAKSGLGVLSACIKHNQEVEIICNGSDENDALQHMIGVIKKGLGEDITE